MDELASIDISPIASGGKDPATVDLIERACRDIGFMYIQGHGIPDELITRVRRAVADYFDRDDVDKRADCVRPGNYRGYIPLGFFTENRGGQAADEYEGYKLHFETDAADPIRQRCDLYGPNHWPANAAELKSVVTDYWQHCDRVASCLLRAMSESLGVDGRSFLTNFEPPLTNMSLLHYPPGSPGSFGIHPHKDTDALTILAPDAVGGLMVRKRDDSGWLDATAPDGALVVNIGDMMEIWSGGYFVSTPHKVVNRSGKERYSFPYFAVPRYDVVVKPLCNSVPGFGRVEMHAGDASRKIWLSNWPDATPIDAELDPATP